MSSSWLVRSGIRSWFSVLSRPNLPSTYTN